MTAVLLRALRSERRPMLGWVAGMLVLCLVTLGSWPAVRGSGADVDRILAQLPTALTAFLGEGVASFSAAGIVGSRLYGTIGLGLVVGLAVSRGARAIGGEAQDGTLELLLTQPVSRTSFAVGKVLAASLSVALLVVVETLVLLLANGPLELGFAVADVLAAAVGLYVVAAVFGALAFLVGAATLQRQAAVACAAGAAAGLFLLTGLAALVRELDTVAQLSPFSHYDGSRVLAGTFSALPLAGFAAVVVALVAAGVLVLDRRDVA